jgi:two-component system, NarL family, invasion response regulator UvrY
MKNHYHTIGLVDDHVLLRGALAGLINSFKDYKVTLEASNGYELLGMLNKKNQPEIMVMDINMPQMDGFETCAKLSSKFPSIKILALSMHSEESVIIKMIRAGAKGYLLKSASPDEIHNAFNALLNKQFYLPEAISERIALGLQSGDDEVVDLNEREIEFIKLICLELSHKEIGNRMHISKRTVDYYRDALFKKLNTNTRVGLVKYAIKHDLI